MDGTYQVSLVTPMGTLKGSIELHADEGRLTGALAILGGTHPISGIAKDDGFSFSGEIMHMMGKINYTVNGTAEGSALNAVTQTNYGSFNLTGTKTS